MDPRDANASKDISMFHSLLVFRAAIIEEGHFCKNGNMRCPGTLKNQKSQFEEKK